jgi:hypothetical protein
MYSDNSNLLSQMPTELATEDFDFYSSNFPYQMPSDLGADYSYPDDRPSGDVVCDCFLCVSGMLCSKGAAYEEVLLSANREENGMES